jgi:peptidylprolyl isomerase
MPPLVCGILVLLQAAAEPPGRPATPPVLTTAEVLAAAKPDEWRAIDPENTLYLELASGRVVIELAPSLSPKHVANIKALAREHYYDGLVIVRSQDNYVVQWGDPNADDASKRRPFRASQSVPGELVLPAADLGTFTPVPDGDVYAPQAGFAGGFPAGRDPATGRGWLAHCYAMVGVGRGNDPASGNGTELYVVIGHAPRHLDRNAALVGRVVQGMELLSTLPRGTGPLGFYEKPDQYVPVRSVRVASDVPAKDRVALEALRTDSATFKALIAARRDRREEWFVDHAGRVELCNVPLPVRRADPR